MIDRAKVEGLRQALARDHVVRFKNGSQVEYEDCPKCEGRGQIPEPIVFTRDPDEDGKLIECPRCGGERVRVMVTRSAGGVARYRLDSELERAYVMALEGPPPKEQPKGDPSLLGDAPPW